MKTYKPEYRTAFNRGYEEGKIEMKMYVVCMEWGYATPSLYTRATLEEAQAVRDELLNDYTTAKRVGIYEYMPIGSSLPGTLVEMPNEVRFPETKSTE